MFEVESMMDELIARQFFAGSGCCIQSTKQLMIGTLVNIKHQKANKGGCDVYYYY